MYRHHDGKEIYGTVVRIPISTGTYHMRSYDIECIEAPLICTVPEEYTERCIRPANRIDLLLYG